MHTKTQSRTLWPLPSCRVSTKVGNNCQWQLIRIGDLVKVKWRYKGKKQINKCAHVHMPCECACERRESRRARTRPQCQDNKLKSSWPCVHKISHRTHRPALEHCIVTERSSNWGSLFKLREGKGWRLSFSLLFRLLFLFDRRSKLRKWWYLIPFNLPETVFWSITRAGCNC